MKKMLFDNILIKLVDKKTKMIIADQQARIPNKGIVVQAGSGDFYGYPVFVGTSVKPGDFVIFSKDRAMEIDLKGEKYYVVKERDVLGVLDEDEVD